MFEKDTDFLTLMEQLPATLRYRLQKCEQDPIWHPEGSVYEHMKIVVDNVHKLFGEDKDLLVAAIFHDLGKLDCRQVKEKDGMRRVSAIGHEHASLKYIDEYFNRFKAYTTNKEKVTEIVENHMKAHLYENGTIKKKGKREKFEALPHFEDIMKFTKCDGKPV